MTEKRTVCCRDCYDTCSLLAAVGGDGELISVRGDPDHPLTRGFVCARGACDPRNLRRGRVESPCLMRDGRATSIGWDAALDLLEERLRASLSGPGPASVLHLSYAGNEGLLTGHLPQRLWRAIGATLTDQRLCTGSGHAALALHYGLSHGLAPVDLPDFALAVFWGFNAAVSAPHIWSMARQARRARRTRIIAIDPRPSQTAQRADTWIRPRPGTDTVLALGIMHALGELGAIDRAFLAGHANGLAELEAVIAGYPPDRVCSLTGIGARELDDLARAYASLRPGATLIGIGMQKRASGADQVRSAALLPSLLGQHRGWFYSNSQAWRVDDALISGESLADAANPVIPQVELGRRLKSGQFSFVFVSGTNPAATYPRARDVRDGLSRRGVFSVVHETHWTETCHVASLVLPAPTYLEKDDLVIPWAHDQVQISAALCAPCTDSRSEYWLMQELARRLGRTEPWLQEDPWEALGRATRHAFRDGGWPDLRAGRRLRLARRPIDEYPTPSGRIELAPAAAREFGLSPVPTAAEDRPARGEFHYLTSASARHTSSQFRNVLGPIPAIVHVHPNDARELGIEDGEEVRIANESCGVIARAKLDPDQQPGVLWSPRQFIDRDGTAQNALMPDAPQACGGAGQFQSARVRISKTGAEP